MLWLIYSIQNFYIRLNIAYTTETPVIFWQLEIWSDDNQLLKQAYGEALPATIDFPLPEESNPDSLECNILVRDIFGNQASQEIKNLFQSAALGEDEEEKLVEEKWNSDF